MAYSVIKKFLIAAPFIAILGASAFVYFYITPDQLVSFIGVKNAYVLMFSFAALGGATTFNTVPYYSILFILATAGVNPLLLGLSSALGVMLGDSVSYAIGRQGGTVLPVNFQKLFERIRYIAENHPQIFPFVCLVYGSISPFSNDFITIPAGMARISYIRVMAPLAVGNIIFNIALAYLAFYGSDVVRFLF